MVIMYFSFQVKKRSEVYQKQRNGCGDIHLQTEEMEKGEENTGDSGPPSVNLNDGTIADHSRMSEMTVADERCHTSSSCVQDSLNHEIGTLCRESSDATVEDHVVECSDLSCSSSLNGADGIDKNPPLSLILHHLDNCENSLSAGLVVHKKHDYFGNVTLIENTEHCTESLSSTILNLTVDVNNDLVNQKDDDYSLAVKVDQQQDDIERTALHDIDRTAPPHDIKLTALPHDIERTEPPHDIERNAPPHDIERTVPPHDIERTAPPHDIERNVPPHDIELTAPPHDIELTAPPHDIELTAPPHDIEQAAPPHDIELTAPPHDIERTAPPHEIERTALHDIEVVQSIPQHCIQGILKPRTVSESSGDVILDSSHAVSDEDLMPFPAELTGKRRCVSFNSYIDKAMFKSSASVCSMRPMLRSKRRRHRKFEWKLSRADVRQRHGSTDSDASVSEVCSQSDSVSLSEEEIYAEVNQDTLFVRNGSQLEAPTGARVSSLPALADRPFVLEAAEGFKIPKNHSISENSAPETATTLEIGGRGDNVSVAWEGVTHEHGDSTIDCVRLTVNSNVENGGDEEVDVDGNREPVVVSDTQDSDDDGGGCGENGWSEGESRNACNKGEATTANEHTTECAFAFGNSVMFELDND